MNQYQEKVPTGIYVVGVGMLLFGLLSFCCSGLSIFSATQDQEAQLRGNPFVDQAMVDGILQAQETTLLPVVAAAVVSVLVSMALLVFSGFTLMRKPLALHAPIVLFVAMGWALVHASVTIWAQMVQVDAMEPLMRGNMGGGPEADAAMAAGMKMGMGFTLCLYGGWALAKLGFFLVGALYLRKPAIRAHLGGPPVYADQPPGGGYGGPPQGGGGYGAPPQGGGGGYQPPPQGGGGYGGPPQGPGPGPGGYGGGA